MNETEVIRLHGDHARAMVRALGWYLPGGEREDLEQEALIALLLAARSYEPEFGIPFWSYAAMIIRRRLVTAIRLASAEKHGPLSYARRYAKNELGEEIEALELLPDPVDLEQRLQAREDLRELVDSARELSELEARALFGFASGYSYRELDGELSAGSQKRVDNAIQRARVKLRRAA